MTYIFFVIRHPVLLWENPTPKKPNQTKTLNIFYCILSQVDIVPTIFIWAKLPLIIGTYGTKVESSHLTCQGGMESLDNRAGFIWPSNSFYLVQLFHCLMKQKPMERSIFLFFYFKLHDQMQYCNTYFSGFRKIAFLFERLVNWKLKGFIKKGFIK